MSGMIISALVILGLYAFMHFMTARAVSQYDGSFYIKDDYYTK